MPTKRQRELKAKQITEYSSFQTGEVVAYTRVSTEEQALDGYGIADQAVKVKAESITHEWPEPIIYSDPGVSGTIHPTEREEMRKIIDGINEGTIKAVIVSSLDRIGRTRQGIFYFTDLVQSKNIMLVSIKEKLDTSTAAGQLVMSMFAILAQFERDTISERTIAGLGEKYRRDGDAGGNLPYGYLRQFALVETKKGMEQKTVDIDIDERAAEVVRLVYRLRALPKYEHRLDGPRMSLRMIAQEVKKIQPYSSKGGEWTAMRIREILLPEKELIYRGGQRGDSKRTWPIILKESTEA